MDFVPYMRDYFDRHRKKILPIAIFSYDKMKEESGEYRITVLSLDVVTFRFHTLVLKNQPWRQYIKQDNPVAAALLSKMGYTEYEHVEVKKEFLRMLARLELNPARNQMLTGFFETYLKLSDEEERQLTAEIKKLDTREEMKVMEFITSYERRGMEKGIEKGKIEGKIESICTILDTKFGDASIPVQKRIYMITNEDALQELLKKIFATDSLQTAESVVEEMLDKQNIHDQE